MQLLLLHVVIACGILLLGTAAQECASRENYTVHTQDEVDTLTRNCTEIVGELGLVDWSGPFTLPNITRIGTITLYSGDVSSVDLPELEYFGGNLILTDLLSLSRVSLPKLEYIESLHLRLVGDAPEVDFPKLANASSIYLRGNFSTQSFDSLRTVEKLLDICNGISCGFYTRMDASTSMSLSFPVLERVGSLKVGGNVTTLSTPEVTAITCSNDECDWAALHLRLYGSSPIAVNFPKLNAMWGNFYIRGDIDSISLPALRDYTYEFIAVPYEPLNITLPVETGHKFLFSGNVSDINLPNLKSFSRIHVNSDLKIDCDELWDDIKRTSGPLNESNATEYFQCSVGVSVAYSGVLKIGTTIAVMVLGMVVGGLL
ncbi:hypothetical protein BJX63DRAFT_247927 [Aspergillus granulosus]|uniref:Protein ecm33 n=1 Tax=Aspergillus granulosus TaxID=176169 RepID=A0ABR4HC83_9EURO